jgi:hypothetical protein
MRQAASNRSGPIGLGEWRHEDALGRRRSSLPSSALRSNSGSSRTSPASAAAADCYDARDLERLALPQSFAHGLRADPNETCCPGGNCASGQIFVSEDLIGIWPILFAHGPQKTLRSSRRWPGIRREEIAAELNRGVSSVAVKAHQLSISLRYHGPPKRRPSTAASAPGH